MSAASPRERRPGEREGHPGQPSWPGCVPPGTIRRAVSLALEEDLSPLGDLSAALLSRDLWARGAIVSRRAGVLAGAALASESYRQVDPRVQLSWVRGDGDMLESGTAVAFLEGPLTSVLTGERTALNFLCHLSGVASATRRFVEAARAVSGSVIIMDTRKTTPGLRSIEKAAVRAGGGRNHRGNLAEAVLIKDNHLVGITITEAVVRARDAWPGRMVEVECDRVDQVLEAVDAGATVVMLDNMDPATVALCVAQVDGRLAALRSGFQERAGRRSVLLEVSGGITLENVADYAATGVDIISVGAITHSAPALDIGLDLEDIVARSEMASQVPADGGIGDGEGR